MASGARRTATPAPTRARAYFAHHTQTLVASLGRLWQAPFETAMTLLVIGLALALPAALHVLLQNARAATGQWDNVLDMSAYLEDGRTTDEGEAMAAEWRARNDVADVEVIAPARALEDFRAYSGFGDALDALPDNPLPVTLVITPAAGFADDTGVTTLANAIGATPGVAHVQLDTAWVRRFHAILDLVRRGVWLTALLLAGAVLVIIGNTIRMDIANRREEIEIVKLIGASDGFIRRPFLYSGLWYGLGGGVTAALVTLATGQALAGPVQRLAGQYGSTYELIGLDVVAAAVLIGGGAALGWLGSFFAATRHMRRIEPV